MEIKEFIYSGLNQQGALTSGSVFANSIEHARKKLEAKHIQIVKIGPIPLSRKISKGIKKAFGQEDTQLSDKEALIFFKEILALVNAGLDLYEALEHIKDMGDIDKKISSIARSLIFMIEDGVLFGDALYHIGFRRSLADTVNLGAKMGNYTDAIESIIKQISLQQKIKKELVSTFAGPIMMILIIFIATLASNEYLAPLQKRVIMSIVDNPDEVPMLSKITFWLGDYGNTLMLSIAFFMVSVFFAIKIVAKVHEPFLLWLDSKKFEIPVFGHFYKNQELANIAYMLSFSISSGEKQSTILSVMKEQISSPYLKHQISQAYEYVSRNGDLMSTAFEKVGLNKVIVTFLKRAEISERQKGRKYLEDVAEAFREKTLIQLELMKSMSETISIFVIAISGIPLLIVSLGPSLDQIQLIVNKIM